MIQFGGISKKIGNKQVLKNLSFHVPRNRITALCGPNGAGKTTLIRLILGLLKPDQGVIKMDCSYNDVSFQLHNPCLFPDLTLRENIRFFTASKKKILDLSVLDSLLREFTMTSEIDAKVSTYSQGMQQKAELIRLLMEKPSLVILDEPTSNLDPLGKVMVRTVLKRLIRENDATILLTSHLLGEVEQMSDQVIILNEGMIRWQGMMNDQIIRGDKNLEDIYIEVMNTDTEEHEHEAL